MLTKITQRCQSYAPFSVSNIIEYLLDLQTCLQASLFIIASVRRCNIHMHLVKLKMDVQKLRLNVHLLLLSVFWWLLTTFTQNGLCQFVTLVSFAIKFLLSLINFSKMLNFFSLKFTHYFLHFHSVEWQPIWFLLVIVTFKSVKCIYVEIYIFYFTSVTQ